MNLALQPWHLLVMFLARWINRQQQEMIEYLRTETLFQKRELVRNEFFSTMISGEDWMKPTARELTNHEDGFLNGIRYSIMDRDTKFCESFRTFLSNEDVEPVRLPPRSPNMNAHLERFFGSLKFEGLDRLILFGEKAMRNAVRQYLSHYHAERPHQGLHNEMIVPLDHPPVLDANIEKTERLGDLLRSYRRAA